MSQPIEVATAGNELNVATSTYRGEHMGLQRIKRWFRRAVDVVEEEAEGAIAVATPPPGDVDRETSTNAQAEGAVGQPWS